MRENAESIAFYSGDQRESELAGARLARTIATIFGKARIWAGLFVCRWEGLCAPEHKSPNLQPT